MKKFQLSIIRKSYIGFILWAVLQASAVQAAIVNFTSLVDPEPDLLMPTSHTYLHDLTSVGFNPATDALISAELHLYFIEENWAAFTDDSVSIHVDNINYGMSEESSAPPFENESWDDIFTIDVSLLQSDGVISVNLQSGGGTYLIMSELSAQADVIPIPPSVWLFGSGLLGLIGVSRHKKAT